MTVEAAEHGGMLPRAADADVTDDFDAWVAPHLSLLRVLAAREIGDADADDVVQDALVRAWRRRHTFDPDRGSARAWLIAVLPCWQQFVDTGSQFDIGTLHGILGLRYSGSAACTVIDRPRIALLNSDGEVVRPDGQFGTPIPGRTVHPGQTVRLTVDMLRGCLTVPDGTYSLLVQLDTVTQVSRATAITMRVGTFHLEQSDGCVVPALTIHSELISNHLASTLVHLTRIARQEGVSYGDPSASADAVQITYGAVERSVTHSTSSDISVDDDVWLVQLHFSREVTCGLCKTAPGIRLPRGHDALLVLRQPGLSFSDSILRGRPYRLSELGTVVQLIP